ncbi:MAG: hypothetical protein ACOCUS_02345 [Polyangiales bacterium]
MMRRLTRKAVLHAVEAGLFATSWALLGAFTLGDRLGHRIPRTPTRGEYV